MCQMRDLLGTSDIEHSNDHNDVKDLSFRNHLNQLQRNHINGIVSEHAASTGAAINNSGLTSNSTTSSSSTVPLNNPTSSTTPSANGNTDASASATSTTQQPHQAPVITSTGPASLLHHTDSSNHDFDSSREPIIHTDTSNMHSPPPRETTLSHHHHAHLHQHSHLMHHHQDSLLQGRLRNFSESSHDIEHNNNYKYKNHIKERFNHELHDEETSSEICPGRPLLQSDNSHAHAHSDHSKDGTEPEIAPIMAKKRKLAEAANDSSTMDDIDCIRVTPSSIRNAAGSAALLRVEKDEKPFAGAFSDIKTETIHNHKNQLTSAPTSTTSTLPGRSFAVPIFALHGQGTYYVPLNVDYNILVPFLNGVDLLDKNFTSMPVVHPININVNFMPNPTNNTSPTISASNLALAAVTAGKQQQTASNVVNGTVAAIAAAAMAKAITNSNGW